MSGIDIEKEREWWETYDGDCAEDKAQLYLDKLEDMNAKLEGKDRALSALRDEIRHAKEDLEKLRAQLADQRARDIRMIAATAFGGLVPQIALEGAVIVYDGLAVIEVPAKKKGSEL